MLHFKNTACGLTTRNDPAVYPQVDELPIKQIRFFVQKPEIQAAREKIVTIQLSLGMQTEPIVRNFICPSTHDLQVHAHRS